MYNAGMIYATEISSLARGNPADCKQSPDRISNVLLRTQANATNKTKKLTMMPDAKQGSAAEA